MDRTVTAEPVWEQTVDNGRYRCRVERTGAYTGTLIVERDGDSGPPILSRDVGLAYQAIFGPDVADVAEWQSLCIEAIDADYEGRGEEVPDD